jgi:hypothetical protein
MTKQFPIFKIGHSCLISVFRVSSTLSTYGRSELKDYDYTSESQFMTSYCSNVIRYSRYFYSTKEKVY